MSTFGNLTEQELKLTAAVYARMGAVAHLRKTGRLPDKIGGLWNVIPMRIIIQERGADLTLTADEQLVYEAILREGQLPGGAVRLADQARNERQGPLDKSEDGADANRRT
jgi:hypothetical protein